jgi:hypothetical protein
MHRKAEKPFQGSTDMPTLALPLSKTEVFVIPQWKAFFSSPRID